MVRVLVCDDSSTARALLVEILRSDPEIEVVGEARDGVEAVELVQRLRPQVVTMDIHMPRLDGLAATKEIMITAPTPIVLVTGSTSVHDVAFAMNALRLGAVALLEKAPGPHAPGFEEAARKLCNTVRAMAGVKVVRQWRARELSAAGPNNPGAEQRAEVVAIVTSTGGPPALERLLGRLPPGFRAPLLVVQHITPGFLPGLVSWLNTVSPLHVKAAEHGEALRPGIVYLAPDDCHLGVAGRTIALSQAAPVGGFRPSGTYLLESVARAYGPAAVALILTGMGEDGVVGLAAVRRAGGRVIAQDEQSCVVYGMPAAAVAAGLADQVLPLGAMADELVRLAGVRGPAGADP